MKILIGCEESQRVCIEFRKRGFEAFSCDLQECSGGHPNWHIQDDIFKVIAGCHWDALIAFPPCTHLACAGGSHFKTKRENGLQKEAILFFYQLLTLDIPHIALENPKGILSSDWYIQTYFPEILRKLSNVGLPGKPTQVIQPFYFGDPFRKYTCLWLKNLPKLIYATENNLFENKTAVQPNDPLGEFVRKGKYRPGTVRKLYWYDVLPKKNRGKVRSKTFPGIASAMAEQWGNYLKSL